jgi:serine/threonine protein kinase
MLPSARLFRGPPVSSEETTRFGKYELLDRIAAGGMAEIFRARYEPAKGVSKQVVIKRILPAYAENKGFIGMFTNEAKIAMGLSHGNIAQVFDFGAIDGDYFLAMELVDGQPLSKVAKRAKELGLPVLPSDIAAFIVAELLKGLHYAHTRLDEDGRPLRIVHRDVSPQNVLLGFEEKPEEHRELLLREPRRVGGKESRQIDLKRFG